MIKKTHSTITNSWMIYGCSMTLRSILQPFFTTGYQRLTTLVEERYKRVGKKTRVGVRRDVVGTVLDGVEFV